MLGMMGSHAAVAACLCSAVARAEDRATPKQTSSLSWVRLPGAEACISARELSESVERRLHRSVFVSPSVADISIEGRIEKDKGGYHAALGGTRRDGTSLGHRDLHAATCRDLDEGLSLVVALMIDPDALAPPAPRPDEAKPPEVIRERIIIREIHEVSPAPIPREPKPWQFGAFADGQLGLQRFPEAAWGAEVGLALEAPGFIPLEAAFAYWPPSTWATGSRTVTWSAFDARLRACPQFLRSKAVALGACLGMRTGAVSAAGGGFSANDDQSRFLLDADAAARLRVTLAGGAFAFVSAGGGAALVRQRFVMLTPSGTETLFTRPSFFGEAGLGVGIDFSP